MDDHAYVAFLDILGYKEALGADKRAGTQKFKERMTRAFRVFESVNRSRYAYQAISDSIFISCSERDAVDEFLSLLREVYLSFLCEELLIRGGVSFGQHFQNQTITYSPALTKAYELESKVAQFPRVMIDSNILEMYPALIENHLVLRSGCSWFLNVVTNETFERAWQAANATCINSRAAIEQDEKVRIKHRWLQDFLLESADAVKRDRPQVYLGTFDPPESPSSASPCGMAGQLCPSCGKGILDIDPAETGVVCSVCGLFLPAAFPS